MNLAIICFLNHQFRYNLKKTLISGLNRRLRFYLFKIFSYLKMNKLSRKLLKFACLLRVSQRITKL